MLLTGLGTAVSIFKSVIFLPWSPIIIRTLAEVRSHSKHCVFEGQKSQEVNQQLAFTSCLAKVCLVLISPRDQQYTQITILRCCLLAVELFASPLPIHLDPSSLILKVKTSGFGEVTGGKTNKGDEWERQKVGLRRLLLQS